MAIHKKPNEKDYITNKVLATFSLCLLGVLLLMVLYRVAAYASTYMLGLRITQIICGIGILGVIGGALKIKKERGAQVDTRFRLLRGQNIVAVSAIVAACMAIILLAGPEVIRLLYVILPAIAVYYLIYYTFPREFFVVSIDCGLMIGLLYLVRQSLASASHTWIAWVACAVALVLCLVQILIVLSVKKHGCKRMVNGRMTDLFSSNNAYTIMLISALLLAILPIIAAILGTQVAYYLIFAAFAYLFVTVVYYTVKLM